MSLPSVVAVREESPAARAGLAPGDEIVSINGRSPRDVIEYQFLVDPGELDLELRRGGLELSAAIDKDDGEPLGIEVSSAVFDRIRTCDNHCEFCFIHQLPKGLRPSLYVKDDDYRLSFLYGNFTTLTRFTEADLERVVSERLSPLFVSIHATDPEVRARLLRNRRGAVSLRWLRALLDHGIEVHGQVVVCPGINDGAVLHDTLTGLLDQYPDLATAAVVPLGVSRYSNEAGMRPHTTDEAAAVVDAVAEWQPAFVEAVGRRLVFAADEYHLLARRAFPDANAYEGFPQHENGVGIVRAFERAFFGDGAAIGVRPGFFSAIDGAPAEGYRSPRQGSSSATGVDQVGSPIAIVTGEYGAAVLGPLVDALGRDDVRVVPVRNEFFGGNIAVAGLMTGQDVARALGAEPEQHRYLLPDVCLSQGRFLDGTLPADLPRPVQVVPTDGRSLRRTLDEWPARPAQKQAQLP
jgi:putative radical SAM enzyme (TIGR03279 family)